MARTLIQIKREMEKLEKEAERVRADEVTGVIQRMKTAIDFYGLTVNDLFASANSKAAKRARSGIGGIRTKIKKAASRAKYKDAETGKTWTGHGKRPGWFVKGIESGMKAEDMAA